MCHLTFQIPRLVSIFQSASAYRKDWASRRQRRRQIWGPAHEQTQSLHRLVHERSADRSGGPHLRAARNMAMEYNLRRSINFYTLLLNYVSCF